MQIRLYFDKVSGDVFFVNNMYTTTTKERDLEVFPILSERNIEAYDYIDVSQNQYSQDFAESNDYRVNVETKTLEFSYPDPNNPDAEPVFVKPLTEQIKSLEFQQQQTNEDLSALMDFVITGGM